MYLLDVLQKVTDVDDLGLHLGVPKHELEIIRQDFCKTKERKREMLQWWLDHTVNPTWGRVISALRAMNKPVLANAVALVSKRESLYEPCEDSLRWEVNLKKIEPLDQRLQKLQQHSEDLEMKWKKGEKEWRVYLKECKQIEEDWEDFIKDQQTQESYITFELRHSELLHRYLQLERRVQKHIARSKELRDFFEKVRKHRRRLQQIEVELNEWEKALEEQVLELQVQIVRMESLGEKFLGEANNCRERLEKSRERLQTCRKKMSECRDELTKSERQLQKCQEKLIECEMNLKRCRDELSNDCEQITKCIEGLKKKSEGLSSDQFIVSVWGYLGVGMGTLVGIIAVGAAAGRGVGAVISALFCIVVGSVCDIIVPAHGRIIIGNCILGAVAGAGFVDLLNVGIHRGVGCVAGVVLAGYVLAVLGIDHEVVTRPATFIGTGVGAGVGAAVGIWVGGEINTKVATLLFFVPVLIGAVIGIAVGLLLRYMWLNKLEKRKEKLHKCKRELSDCCKVVKRCREVLRNSQGELEELLRIVNELEQIFHRL